MELDETMAVEEGDMDDDIDAIDTKRKIFIYSSHCLKSVQIRSFFCLIKGAKLITNQYYIECTESSTS